ncbi:hypothetical protein BJ742DRAFT_741598 [Cladochytrium replicatum]|nr:hypothetical protein BJ742DRAFT_741598 [Cladochytrium replicatum]
MAQSQDIHKWADHAIILQEYAKELLPALYAAKQVLEPTAPYFYTPENDPPQQTDGPKDPCGCPLHRSMASEYEFTYNESVLKIFGGKTEIDWQLGQSAQELFSSIKSNTSSFKGMPCKRKALRYISDPSFTQIFKYLEKKFPGDGGVDFMKVNGSSVFLAQAHDIACELQPFYELLFATAEYCESTASHILQVIMLPEFSIETDKELGLLLLENVVNFATILDTLANGLKHAQLISIGTICCLGGDNPKLIELMKMSISVSGVVIPQFRDEITKTETCLLLHNVRENHSGSVVQLHKERRDYLKHSLRSLLSVEEFDLNSTFNQTNRARFCLQLFQLPEMKSSGTSAIMTLIHHHKKQNLLG